MYRVRTFGGLKSHCTGPFSMMLWNDSASTLPQPNSKRPTSTMDKGKPTATINHYDMSCHLRFGIPQCSISVYCISHISPKKFKFFICALIRNYKNLCLVKNYFGRKMIRHYISCLVYTRQQLPMNRLGLRNSWLRFKILAKLPIVLGGIHGNIYQIYNGKL